MATVYLVRFITLSTLVSDLVSLFLFAVDRQFFHGGVFCSIASLFWGVNHYLKK